MAKKSGVAIKREEARLLVIREWDAWAPKNNVPLDGTATAWEHGQRFYHSHLRVKHPYLFDFMAGSDHWQTVHGWLKNAGKVKD